MWRKTWREGLAPLMPDEGLEALRDALADDDALLVQGATTVPLAMLFVHDWPCTGACAVSYCGWKGKGLETVGEVKEFFARTCYESDLRMGESAVSCFINWFDETPRDEMRAALLPEVLLELKRRAKA